MCKPTGIFFLLWAFFCWGTSAYAGNCPDGESTKVNINTASVEKIAGCLTGVGQTKAKAIVAWREKNGNFSQIEQLDEVKGIGKGLIEKNREKVIFQDP